AQALAAREAREFALPLAARTMRHAKKYFNVVAFHPLVQRIAFHCRDAHRLQICSPLALRAETQPSSNRLVCQCSIVSLDWPFDNLGFLNEKFRQMLFYVVRS